MNAARPEPGWRWITPHAFGNDGLRWHVRAYCHIDKKFKDFLLSRCLDRGDGEAGRAAADDTFWNESFEVVLRAQSGAQRKPTGSRRPGLRHDRRLRVCPGAQGPSLLLPKEAAARCWRMRLTARMKRRSSSQTAKAFGRCSCGGDSMKSANFEILRERMA